MKKFLLFCLFAALSTMGFSQDYDYSLAEIQFSGDPEYEKFSYHSNQFLKATEVLMENGTQVRDSLFYDASDNVIRIDGYQHLNGEWTQVSYIDFSYDENGNRISRSSYHGFGRTNFTLGGVYKYHYLDNRLTNWEFLMGGTDLVETGALTYNEEGKVVEELVHEKLDSNSWEKSWKIVNLYNSDGTMLSSNKSFWNGSSWDSASVELFYYDDQKNCVRWETKIGNKVTIKREFDYDLDISIDQIALPINPEYSLERGILLEMANLVTLHRWHTEDEQGNLVYAGDFTYIYHTRPLETTNLNFDADTIQIYPNPSSEFVTVNSVENNIRSISVLDAAGKQVLKVSDVNKTEMDLAVSSLQSGIYYIRLNTAQGIVTQKLVKE